MGHVVFLQPAGVSDVSSVHRSSSPLILEKEGKESYENRRNLYNILDQKLENFN